MTSDTVPEKYRATKVGLQHVSDRVFFFGGFAGLQLWMIFSTALRFLMDPLILPYSGVPHGFLLCKLKISLSKITDLPFRSVPCLKLE